MKILNLFPLFLVLFFLHLSSAIAQDECDWWILKNKKETETLESARSRIALIIEKSMREAGSKILKLRNSKDFQIEQKRNFSDLKTRGDCSSQEIILTQLAGDSLAQKANFIAEEKCSKTKEITTRKANQAATWILDPIDGTTNYAHGMPHFSISLALAVEDQICFGAVYAPVSGEFFYATKDRGAYLKASSNQTAQPIHVSSIDSLNSSLWITGTEAGPSVPAVEKNTKTFELAIGLLKETHDLRRTGSSALDLAYIATGRAEAYFELSEGLNWWDIAAGLLLVNEAGGKTFVLEPKVHSSQVVTYEKPIIYVLASNGSNTIHHHFKTLLDKKFE